MRIYRLKQEKGGIPTESLVVLLWRNSSQAQIQLKDEYDKTGSGWKAFVQDAEFDNFLEYVSGEDEVEQIVSSTQTTTSVITITEITQNISNTHTQSSEKEKISIKEECVETVTVPFRGVHGTSSLNNIASLEQGLDWGKQLGARRDATEYSGPGFYYIPHEYDKGDENTLKKAAELIKSYDKDYFVVAIYVGGLAPECKFKSETKDVLKTKGSLEEDNEGNIELTSINHPMNLWVDRNSDICREIVIRPHLYDEDELLKAIKVVAVLPSEYDARDFIDRVTEDDEGAQDIYLSPTEDGEAYSSNLDFSNKEILRPLSPTLDTAKGHAELKDIMDGTGDTKRLGVRILMELYGDLEMPVAIYSLLVNVAEFAFVAKGIGQDGEGALEIAHPLNKMTGFKILPSRETLEELIEAAKKANPEIYGVEEGDDNNEDESV